MTIDPNKFYRSKYDFSWSMDHNYDASEENRVIIEEGSGGYINTTVTINYQNNSILSKNYIRPIYDLFYNKELERLFPGSETGGNISLRYKALFGCPPFKLWNTCHTYYHVGHENSDSVSDTRKTVLCIVCLPWHAKNFLESTLIIPFVRVKDLIHSKIKCSCSCCNTFFDTYFFNCDYGRLSLANDTLLRTTANSLALENMDDVWSKNIAELIKEAEVVLDNNEKQAIANNTPLFNMSQRSTLVIENNPRQRPSNNMPVRMVMR